MPFEGAYATCRGPARSHPGSHPRRQGSLETILDAARKRPTHLRSRHLVHSCRPSTSRPMVPAVPASSVQPWLPPFLLCSTCVPVRVITVAEHLLLPPLPTAKRLELLLLERSFFLRRSGVTRGLRPTCGFRRSALLIRLRRQRQLGSSPMRVASPDCSQNDIASACQVPGRRALVIYMSHVYA